MVKRQCNGFFFDQILSLTGLRSIILLTSSVHSCGNKIGERESWPCFVYKLIISTQWGKLMFV